MMRFDALRGPRLAREIALLRGTSDVIGDSAARLRTGRAHMLAWGTPRNARLAWDAQGDVVAARMVGLRQEGNPCRMVPSEKG